MKPEEEIIQARFNQAISFPIGPGARATESYLHTTQHKVKLSWHGKGLLVEHEKGGKIVIPAGNIQWVELK